jgi:hypothetical protein
MFAIWLLIEALAGWTCSPALRPMTSAVPDALAPAAVNHGLMTRLAARPSLASIHLPSSRLPS